MKKLTILSVGLVALFFFGSGFAFAHDTPCYPCPDREGYQREFSVTPEQRTRFQELRRRFTEETAQLRGDILSRRMELRTLWANPRADSQAILNKERELSSLEEQMRDKTVQTRLEGRGILTPEQLAQVVVPMLGGEHRMARFPKQRRIAPPRNDMPDRFGRYDMMGYGNMTGCGCGGMW